MAEVKNEVKTEETETTETKPATSNKNNTTKHTGRIVGKNSKFVAVMDDKGLCYGLPLDKYGKYSIGITIEF